MKTQTVFKIFNSIGFVLKCGFWGAFLGFLVLFFMPDSKLTINWGSAQQAWRFIQQNALENEGNGYPKPSLTNISFSYAVEKAFPSVVSINVFRPRGLRDSEQLAPDEKILDVNVGIGSGVILNQQGYVVTNYHVIANADTITINLADGRKRVVNLIAYDADSDIAVLKTDLPELVEAELETTTEVKTGDIVMAIGSPFGRDQSVSLGIVSAVSFNPMRIQTDAAINTGNSGGALINSKGAVVGINQWKLSSRGGGQTGLNYAIPINRVKRIAEDLIQFGRVRPNWLGVNAVELKKEYHLRQYPAIKFGTGFFVKDVEANSPALKAGVQPGDFINRFEGQPIKGVASFYRLFFKAPLGKKVEIELIRDGQLVSLPIQLVERPQKKQ